MVKVKYLIIGAGPSGLAFARTLMDSRQASFIIIEKEYEAGGLCRSTNVDGSPLDIGGGHFLDVRNELTKSFLFSYMSEPEWQKFTRVSDIFTSHYHLNYPYESNIWQLNEEAQIEHLLSISKSGSNQNLPLPSRFSDWIRWKLGETITSEYMLPYNNKVFGIDLDLLGTYWLYKLPKVSFEEVLRSCILRSPYGIIPAHQEFLYPKKHGYGEVFNRIADSLKENLILAYSIKKLELKKRILDDQIQYEILVNTAPWPSLLTVANFPERVQGLVGKLLAAPVEIQYHPKKTSSSSHWTYYASPEIQHHRILHRHNFVSGGNGYWTESNPTVYAKKGKDIFFNEYAYPLNTIQKPIVLEKLLKWATNHAIIGLGRWGQWEHMNSDIAVSNAINLAKKLEGLQ